VIGVFLTLPGSRPVSFPMGKNFAFSICDDTDMSEIKNIKPVYDYLDSLGLRTTKTVWVMPSNNAKEPPNRGATLADSNYCAFIRDLQRKGFEIALHGVRGGDATKDEISRALATYHNIIGSYPRIHINHFKNKDNLYWGSDRLTFGPFKFLCNLFGGQDDYFGEKEESEYFWGDLAKKHIDYVADFSFHEINLFNINPLIPYYDPNKPYVNYWFETSDGSNAEHFIALLSHDNLDKLERQGGVCLVYTHFAYGFCHAGILNGRVRERLKDLASRNGWFVPAGDILDYLRTHNGQDTTMSFLQNIRFEARWIIEKLIHGRS
jgi:hypothetical protein